MNRDGSIYINRGLREGVKIGQEFVVGYSEVIRDPGTGEVLEEIISEVARIQVTTVRENLSICEIIIGQYDDIDKGMKIQLP